MFPLADDDFGFDGAVAILPSVAGECSKDRSVVGVTGAYAVEGSQGTSIASYPNAELDDVMARVNGYVAIPARTFFFMRRCGGISSSASSHA